MSESNDPFTIEDLRERIYRNDEFEYLDGQEIKPIFVPYQKHSFVVGKIGKYLLDYQIKTKNGARFQSRGLYFAVLDDDGNVISSLAPHVMFYHWGKWRAYCRENKFSRVLNLIPDIVVEVLDTHDKYSYIMRKVEYYIEIGISLIWLLDIERKVVVEHSQLYPDGQTFKGDDVVSGGDDAPDFEFRVSDVFDVEDDMPNLTYEEVVQLAELHMQQNYDVPYRFHKVQLHKTNNHTCWKVTFYHLDDDGNIITMDPNIFRVEVNDETRESKQTILF